MVERARLESVWLSQDGSRVRISPSPLRCEGKSMGRARALTVLWFPLFRKTKVPLDYTPTKISAMDIEKSWDKALKHTEIIRARVKALMTTAETHVPYILLSESSINLGDTVVRKGEVRVEKPALFIPPDNPQFEGFEFEQEKEFDQNSFINFLIVRGISLPSLRYDNKTSSLEVYEGKLSSAIKHYEKFFQHLGTATLADLSKVRMDLFTWRRGSAQMVLKVNPGLNNLSIYSVLVTGVDPTVDLFRHLLHYNILQRRESLGGFEKRGKLFIVLKYTLELDLVDHDVLGRHVFFMQEIADQLDTELVDQFGGTLHFSEWDKLDQGGVDDLLENMFG